MRLGVDIVSVGRVGALYARFADKFARRILSETELAVFAGLGCRERRVEFLSGRFCAKEAIYKAMNRDAAGAAVTWRRLSVGAGPGPVALDGRPLASMTVSLSHERDFVVAVALHVDDLA